MPELSIAIAYVIERLDALDGTRDGFYTDHDLITHNSTGACILAQEEKNELSSFGFPVNATSAVINLRNERVPVNCYALAQQVNALIDIAQRLPNYSSMVALTTGNSISEVEATSREEILGIYIVEHMIISLLMGMVSTDMSFSEMFELIPYKSYTRAIDELAETIPNIASEQINIENAREAYRLFEKLGRRYGFSTLPFKPTGSHQ